MIRLLSEIQIGPQGVPPQDVDAALNRDIAARLRTTADHLQAHDSHPYRAASFRLAAEAVAAQPRSLRAIYDERGREGLDALPGVGPRIAAIIDDFLRERAASPAARPARVTPPPVQLLLDADREFRARSVGRAGAPDRIALRELHLQRDGWNLRVFFSHSVRAQELGRTRDWVIVIAMRGGEEGTRHTVVTETRGKLAGRRVVRGREAACRSHYARIGQIVGESR